MRLLVKIQMLVLMLLNFIMAAAGFNLENQCINQKRLFIVLLNALNVFAHGADVSTMVFKEQEDNTWTLQVRSSLDALRKEVKTLSNFNSNGSFICDNVYIYFLINKMPKFIE